MALQHERWTHPVLVEHASSFLQFRMSNFFSHLGLKLSSGVILGHLRKPSARLEQTSDDCVFHQLTLSSDAEKSMPNGSKCHIFCHIRICKIRSHPWCSWWNLLLCWIFLPSLPLLSNHFASFGYPWQTQRNKQPIYKKPAVMELLLQYDGTWWKYVWICFFISIACTETLLLTF